MKWMPLCLVLGACAGSSLPMHAVDAGTADGASDAATSADLAPPGDSVGSIQCGNASCSTAAGQICCQVPGQEFACSAQPCPSGATELDCDGPEDCKHGQVCCAISGGAPRTVCLDSCDYAARVCQTHLGCGPNEGCCPLDSLPVRACVAGGSDGCN